MTQAPSHPVPAAPSTPVVRAALGSSRRSGAEALEEALEAARGALEGLPAFAVVVTSAAGLGDPAAFAAALGDRFGDLPLAGTTSDGLGIDGQHGGEARLAVLLVGGDVRAQPFAVQAPGGADELGLPDLADALDGLDGPAATILAFADPRGLHVPALPRLVERLAPGVPLVGGGSTAAGGRYAQFCNGRVLDGVCAGLALATPRSATGLFVAQGGALVGVRGTVTRIDRGLVVEIDGRPATSLLDALRQIALPAPLDQVAPLLALAVAPGGPEALDRGQFVVRALAGVDGTRRALAVAARVEVGWGACLVLREAIGAKAEVAASARRLAGALGSLPAAGLYFDCASRGERLYGFDGVDEAQIAKALGRFPLLSVKSSFELGPVVVGARPRPELHLYSGVLWVLSSGAMPVGDAAAGAIG